jgi:ribosome-associated protein
MTKNDPAINKERNKEALIRQIVEGILDKKGFEIVDIDLSKIGNSICDNFIICHGTSRRQVEAIAESIEKSVKENTGEKPWHKEGYQNSEWILLDYVDVVVHVFNEQMRKFYNLEGLWADAQIKSIEG